jgi:hypothetical protein
MNTREQLPAPERVNARSSCPKWRDSSLFLIAHTGDCHTQTLLSFAEFAIAVR